MLTSSVTSEMARLQSLLDGIAVTNGASSSVDQPRTRLHLADEFFVEETTSLLVERAVDGDDITLREHVFKLLHSSSLDSLGRLRGEVSVIEPQKLLAFEGLQSLQDSVSDPTTAYGTDNLTLEVKGVTSDVGNVPVIGLDLLMSWNKVANQKQDGHYHMFGNRHDVGAGNLSNSDLPLVGSFKVNVVRSNTSGYTKFELRSLLHEFSG